MKHIGIWIPIEVLHDENLTHTERYLLMDIIQLDKLEKGCFASNEYFSELLNMTKPNISRSLHSLQEKGYISINIKVGSRNHDRVIKMIFEGYQNDTEGLSKREETIDNKTINKTINIYDAFLKELKSKVKTPSKVTKTKDGEKLFKKIEDKQKLISDYISHQEEKKEFAQRITAFMEDYSPTENDWSQYARA